MNKKLLFLLLITISAWPSSLLSQDLKLVANTWPPYVDKNLPERGLAIQLVTEILKKSGYSGNIAIETWPRALEGARLGIFDAIAAAWYSEERETHYLFSDPYLENRLRLVKHNRLPGDYFKLEQLTDKRIGITTDYAYDIDFSKAANASLVTENHLVQNLLNLDNGKVDFVIGDERSLRAELRRYFPNKKDQFEFTPIALPGRSLYLAASRESPKSAELIEKFNATLKLMKEDGSYQRIIEEWDNRLR
jgi:polar amino acid transport system substrate-binding protein